MNKKKVASIILSIGLCCSVSFNYSLFCKVNNLTTEFNSAKQKIGDLNTEYKRTVGDMKKKNSDQEKTIKLQLKEIDSLKEDIFKRDKYIEEVNRSVSYNPSNIADVSNTSSSHMKRALKGTPMYELSDYFVEAEKMHGVNAYFLAGLVANESGWNTSTRARSQNNLTGYSVYTTASRGTYFPSKRASILRTARLLKEEYLSSSGQHYNGNSIWSVNQKYCQSNSKPNMSWSNTINQITSDLVGRANSFNKYDNVK